MDDGNIRRRALACAGAVVMLLAGCAGSLERGNPNRSVDRLVYGPPPDRSERDDPATYPSTTKRKPSFASQTEGRIGVALAGGGTKAASYAMGVLAALAERDERAPTLSRIDAISTVSGGGYAALFLYSKLMLSQEDNPRPALKSFFADCMPRIYAGVLRADIGSNRWCSERPTDEAMKPYLFQHYVRCRQDVLENDCHLEYLDSDGSEYANAVALGIGTAMAVLPNFVARTLFDWPVNLSPSREAYLQGIGTAYGLYPKSLAALAPQRDVGASCGKDAFRNCDAGSGLGRLDRKDLSFNHLARYAQTPEGERMPTWIINATSSRSRSLFGWARAGRRDFTKYTLQMSPYRAESGFYGEIGQWRKEFDLLGAVTAAAAFFDSNQTALTQPWRLLAALAQHAGAFDWGVDIDNPNVTENQRGVHMALPLWPWPWTQIGRIPSLPYPTYLLDGAARLAMARPAKEHSAFIRILDGGNNDDLGAYTLIQAGMKHIVIADHAQDRNGDMGDLCLLHNEVRLRSDPPKRLLVPGLKGFGAYCQRFVEESECAGGACMSVPGIKPPVAVEGRYPIDRWRHPVLLGCIRDRDTRATDDGEGECSGDVDTYLYILKPAIDRAWLLNTYQRDGKVLCDACKPDNPGLCEVMAYLLTPDPKTGGKADPGAFPQHSTAGMTFASNARRYGAYRELARWQTHRALELLFGGKASFDEMAKKQLDDKIELVAGKVHND